MSDYWAALTRAALGLPGSADPRPRSRFEPDAPEPAEFEIGNEVERRDAPHDQSIETKVPRLAGPPPPTGLPPAQSSSMTPPAPTRSEQVDRTDAAARVQAPVIAHPAEHAAAPTLPSVREVHAPRGERTSEAARESPPDVRVVVATPAEHAHPQVAIISAGDVAPDAVAPHDRPLPAVAAAIESTVAQPAEDRDTAGPLTVVAEPTARQVVPSPTVAPELPPLVIEIDRVEIRIEPDGAATTPPPASRNRDAATIPSLGDYLAQRSESRR